MAGKKSSRSVSAERELCLTVECLLDYARRCLPGHVRAVEALARPSCASPDRSGPGVRALEAIVKVHLGFHDLVEDLDISFHTLCGSLAEEEWSNWGSEIHGLMETLVRADRELLALCDCVGGNRVKGGRVLRKKHGDLVSGLTDQWDYDSPSFQRILDAAERDKAAGRIYDMG